MKSILKAFSTVALSGAMVLPALAGTDTKDLKKVIEDQGINYVETAQKGITLKRLRGYQLHRAILPCRSIRSCGPSPLQNPGAGPGNTQNAGGLRSFDNSNATLQCQRRKNRPWKRLFRTRTNGPLVSVSTPSMVPMPSTSEIPRSTASGAPTTLVSLSSRPWLSSVSRYGNGLDIYMGKFVTFLGYEVIESPANLNFSRGLLFTNAIPLTHTGIYADYKFNRHR